MPREVIHYSNKDITVVWRPKLCIHSTRCWKGLIEVFNPKERPWVKMEGADTNRIIAQVLECPSGALSYFRNGAKEEETELEKTPAVDASLVKVEVSANGPYLIRNQCVVVHSDGREEVKEGTVALCRCGASANKPWCDGSHRKIGFSDDASKPGHVLDQI